MLRERRRVRVPVLGEADLDHLPVALVQADPHEVLVVVVVEEPVLEPREAVLVLDRVAVRPVRISGVGVQPPGVLDVAPTGCVDEVGRLHLGSARVLLLAEELERERLLVVLRPRRREDAPALSLEDVRVAPLGPVLVEPLREHGRGVGAVALERVVLEVRVVAVEQLLVGHAPPLSCRCRRPAAEREPHCSPGSP